VIVREQILNSHCGCWSAILKIKV